MAWGRIRTEGSNAATIEDVYRIPLERERAAAEIRSRVDLELRKREVYDTLVKSFGIFPGGRQPQQADIDALHDIYARSWVWASDHAIRAISNSLHLLEQRTADRSSVPMRELKAAYQEAILALRKDIFSETDLEAEDFRIVTVSA